MDALLDAFRVVVIVGASLLVALAVAAWLGLRKLRRRNRVSAQHPTDAPFAWLYLPTGAARLHRRLVAAGSVAALIGARQRADGSPLRGRVRGRRAAEDPGRIGELATRLEREAVALDRHLSAVGRLGPTQRKHSLRLMVGEVEHIERLAARLTTLDADRSRGRVSGGVGLPGADGVFDGEAGGGGPVPGDRAPDSVADELATDIAHLEQARAELRRVEMDAGLGA